MKKLCQKIAIFFLKIAIFFSKLPFFQKFPKDYCLKMTFLNFRIPYYFFLIIFFCNLKKKGDLDDARKKQKLHKNIKNCQNAKNCHFPKNCQNRGRNFTEGQITAFK